MTKLNEFFRKLFKGEIALNIVFWIYFVLITFVLNSYIELDLENTHYQLTFNKQETLLNLFLFSILFLYTIFIFIAVIRSANKYTGSKVFSFFAKVLVTLNLIITLITSLELIKVYLLEDYFIESQIELYKEQVPIKVNSYTNLKAINKVENKIKYTYQIVNKRFSHIASLNLKNFKEDVQNSLCEDETTLDLLKKNYVLEYDYLDDKNDELIKIVTTKESCGPSIYDLDMLKAILNNQNQP